MSSQDSTSSWLKVTFFCPLSLLEPVSDLVGVLSGVGVEQSPETSEGADISGFFELTHTDGHCESETIEQVLRQLQQEVGAVFALYDCTLGTLQTTLLADEDWATSWQQYFKPFEIVPGLVIKPSWEAFSPENGQQIIEMDPGRAFGTGQHASTQMALSLIQKVVQESPKEKALDVGTGTGILAMATVLFGCKTALGIDNDPEAVLVAQENIAHNQLTAQIDITGQAVQQVEGEYPLVCANIVHDVLIDMAPELVRVTQSGGHLIMAGILKGAQETNILAVYTQLGCSHVASLEQEEWAAVLLQKN